MWLMHMRVKLITRMFPRRSVGFAFAVFTALMIAGTSLASPPPSSTTVGATAGLNTEKPPHARDAISHCRLKGDGSTDDAGALQECVNSLKGGGKIWFPANHTYFLDATVNLKSDV